MLAKAGRLALLVLGFIAAALFATSLFESPPAARAAGQRAVGLCTDPPAGERGRHELTSRQGLRVTVITPTDYEARHRYGLLVFFPPAGFSRKASERFYRFTGDATLAGYIVAFTDALPLSKRAIEVQGDVVDDVAQRWCIDRDRIVYAGHSDGGALSQGIELRRAAPAVQPLAIFASAAGIRAEDLARERCPAPTAVSILHSAGDERFPNYGRDVAQWWARCFACASTPDNPGPGRCADASGCQGGSAVRYCETQEGHSQRPALFSEQLQLLLQ